MELEINDIIEYDNSEGTVRIKITGKHHTLCGNRGMGNKCRNCSGERYCLEYSYVDKPNRKFTNICLAHFDNINFKKVSSFHISKPRPFSLKVKRLQERGYLPPSIENLNTYTEPVDLQKKWDRLEKISDIFLYVGILSIVGLIVSLIIENKMVGLVSWIGILLSSFGGTLTYNIKFNKKGKLWKYLSKKLIH